MKTRKPLTGCGPASAAVGPSWKHYNAHRAHGIPPCPRARRETSWRAAELRQDRLLPVYEPNYRRARNPGPTQLYRYLFADDDCYFGITSTANAEGRHRSHRAARSLIGRKIRSGVPFRLEVLAEYPTRAEAAAEEARLVREGNPFGGALLNEMLRLDAPPSVAAGEPEALEAHMRPPSHICGEEPDRPSAADWEWHKARGTPACGKARANRGLYRAMKRAERAGREFDPDVWRPIGAGRYVCGDDDDYEAGQGHLLFHRRRGEEPCPNAWKANRLHDRNKYARNRTERERNEE